MPIYININKERGNYQTDRSMVKYDFGTHLECGAPRSHAVAGMRPTQPWDHPPFQSCPPLTHRHKASVSMAGILNTVFVKLH